MAAWIKMRADLADDPAVIATALSLDIPEAHVVGCLHRLWAWADAQTRDGNAPCVTPSWLDRYIGVSGFAASLSKAGWLIVDDTGISIPNFHRHMTQTAKERALTTKRVARHRRNASTVTGALPDKRREEVKKPPIPPLRGATVAQLEKEFEEAFWPNVPVKVGKGAAMKAFIDARRGGNRKHRKAVPLEDIVAGLPGFVAYEQHRSGQDDYRPLNPATWLNQARWGDEVSDNGSPIKRTKLVADVPPGSPYSGHSPGDDWEADGFAYRITRDNLAGRRPIDGQWSEWEPIKVKEVPA